MSIMWMFLRGGFKGNRGMQITWVTRRRGTRVQESLRLPGIIFKGLYWRGWLRSTSVIGVIIFLAKSMMSFLFSGPSCRLYLHRFWTLGPKGVPIRRQMSGIMVARVEGKARGEGYPDLGLGVPSILIAQPPCL